MQYKRLVLHATVLFVMTAVLEMTLHESGHFAAALLLDGSPVLYHNAVRN